MRVTPLPKPCPIPDCGIELTRRNQARCRAHQAAHERAVNQEQSRGAYQRRKLALVRMILGATR